ncbi:MAG: hypothetical protein V7L00_31355 [Nostoc sp.]|uniref:hypothetical protein n=1 Tax=Nostoc sp. TaxID=1180 RepID=UPI002FF693B4
MFRRCFQERVGVARRRHRLYTLARRKPEADLPDCDTNRRTRKSMAHQVLEAGVELAKLSPI